MYRLGCQFIISQNKTKSKLEVQYLSCGVRLLMALVRVQWSMCYFFSWAGLITTLCSCHIKISSLGKIAWKFYLLTNDHEHAGHRAVERLNLPQCGFYSQWRSPSKIVGDLLSVRTLIKLQLLMQQGPASAHWTEARNSDAIFIYCSALKFHESNRKNHFRSSASLTQGEYDLHFIRLLSSVRKHNLGQGWP